MRNGSPKSRSYRSNYVNNDLRYALIEQQNDYTNFVNNYRGNSDEHLAYLQALAQPLRLNANQQILKQGFNELPSKIDNLSRGLAYIIGIWGRNGGHAVAYWNPNLNKGDRLFFDVNQGQFLAGNAELMGVEIQKKLKEQYAPNTFSIYSIRANR